MPLPEPPTRKPRSNLAAKSAQELLFKGILISLIGLGVLLSPHVITSPGLQGIVASTRWVGWFAVVLGVAFIGLYLRRRAS